GAVVVAGPRDVHHAVRPLCGAAAGPAGEGRGAMRLMWLAGQGPLPGHCLVACFFLRSLATLEEARHLARCGCDQAAVAGTGARSAFVLSTRRALSARSMVELASNASAVPSAGG